MPLFDSPVLEDLVGENVSSNARQIHTRQLEAAWQDAQLEQEQRVNARIILRLDSGRLTHRLGALIVLNPGAAAGEPLDCVAEVIDARADQSRWHAIVSDKAGPMAWSTMHEALLGYLAVTVDSRDGLEAARYAARAIGLHYGS